MEARRSHSPASQGSSVASFDTLDSERSHAYSPNLHPSPPLNRRSYDSDGSTGEYYRYSYGSASPRKRRKNGGQSRTKRKHSDLISTLPDSILLHILGLLSMKDAVKTGILSKRWEYLWTHIANLVYDDYDEEPFLRPYEQFLNFVNQTLMLHEGSKIKRFDIDFGYEEGSDSQVDLWVRLVTRKRVEELRLDLYREYFDPPRFGGPNPYVLRHHLFTNSSLTKLSSNFCDFSNCGRVNWTSLKSLSIGHAELSDQVIRTILVGSPVLEYLKLEQCEGFNRLDIASKSLRKFVLDGLWDSPYNDNGSGDASHVSVLEIWGPNLQSLEISGDLNRRQCQLRNVSCLVDACLNFHMKVVEENSENSYEEQRNMLRELLEVLNNVKKLTIGTWCIQVLSIWKLNFLPSPLSKLKCLTLNTRLHKWDLPGIASLLESSPDLEKLVINMASPNSMEFDFDSEFFNSYNFNKEKFWMSQKVFKRLLLHLRTVEVFGFLPGRYGIAELATSLIQFLLKNARVLEKMVIYKQKVDGPCPQKLFEAAEKLLGFKRSSAEAVVLFA